ncbi:protein PEP-RELATED DEVELOPMENT ARRESTED 1, chloroplastic [Magnolia sinica]|uniref:protein PEP-RELATED DEVELOPMENT ARRESTED 1, chloroplastic n=1 Tax=Magnolia sinica TaxID=86752 RepID=UPI002658F3D2|nr:protein PEP-RELATED DEVELOPMENT ARRESTED 1, chloroplastic [Magnolia sinica]XP_058103209.1 protein PEP-RELATED DEVELOPMENT ARRESTED 1, chloroplastic [Magnolia sinica]XP_058103210.1 protein PEP-RELATED DEVELOPMENT ARRESTED 1, chloroplastic [Magnolia sinica]
MSGTFLFFPSTTPSSSPLFSKKKPISAVHSTTTFLPFHHHHHHQLKQHRLVAKKEKEEEQRSVAFCSSSYEVGGGFTDGEDFATAASALGRFYEEEEGEEKWESSRYEALLKGGEQVASLLQEMVDLLEDMNMDETSEAAAVELVAQGVIGKRVDQMESGFMMALDYMIQLAEKDNDDQRKSLLEVIKETVLSHLTKKCPPHVQVIGLLCRTPEKESRHELLRRVAAGGGVFTGEKGAKVQLPGANLNDIANQADDLLETMEARPSIPDRKLLARLVLIREEARNMMGGGILDERNDRGLSTLPEAEVNFLTKLVALKPGRTVQEMISNVMQGKDEGADSSGKDEEDIAARRRTSSGIAGRASVTDRKPRPVRPGMFLETVSKVLGGIYAGNVSGITAQHLEWVHQKTLQVLQEIAF